MVGRIMVPHKDAHILIPRAYEYVTVHGKMQWLDSITNSVHRKLSQFQEAKVDICKISASKALK